MKKQALRIGTRGSDLALWQARTVRDDLIRAHGLDPEAVEIVVVRTTGDKIQDRALLEAGGKGLFTLEIEQGLLDGEIDLAVHSAKDMPTKLPDGLTLTAYLEREDVRDAFIGSSVTTLEALPARATIGTASLRRQALLLRTRPDLKIGLLRGNVPTRLRKIKEGQFDGTLLAYAGLKRLGLADQVSSVLSEGQFPPACGQGAIAVECREDNTVVRELLDAVGDRNTGIAIAAERAFLGRLDGSCRAPIAGHAIVSDDRVDLSGLVLSPDGTESYSASVTGPAGDAVVLGVEVADRIKDEAPPRFVAELGLG